MDDLKSALPFHITPPQPQIDSRYGKCGMFQHFNENYEIFKVACFSAIQN